MAIYGELDRKWEVGDFAWIYFGNHQGERTRGQIVHKFTLDDWLFSHYVIEIPTSIDPLLEVRDAGAMWSTP